MIKQPRHDALRSDPGKLFLCRVWLPLVSGGGAYLVLGDNWRGLWVLWPFFLLAVFQLTLADVIADSNALRYRRLFRWKTINYDEIRECRTDWPFAGFLKLNRFVFPWGRLYFVHSGSLYDNPFRKPEPELVRYVTDRMKGVEDANRPQPQEPTRESLPIRTWLTAGMAAILVSLMNSLLLPPEVTQFHPQGDEWPRWLVVYDQAKTIAFSWPWNLLIFALLVLAAAKSNPKRAWVFAFVGGLLLPSLLLAWT